MNEEFEWEKLLKLVVPELIFVLVSSVYLFKLNILNKYLLENNMNNNQLSMLSYNEYQPLKYFAGALLLEIVGVLSIIYLVIYMRKKMSSIWELVVAIIAIIISIVLMIIIFNFINNPILKAVLGATILGIGAVYAMANNN